MRKLITLLALLLWAVTASADSGWVKAVRIVEESIVRITNKEVLYTEHGIPVLDSEGKPQMFAPTCSGVVIDRLRRYVLTAKHCFGEELKVNGKQARVVYADDLDLMVIESSGADKPSARPKYGTLPKGAEVGSLGFGFGLQRSIFRHAFVSEPGMVWPKEEGAWMTTDSVFEPGMSGGPIFDIDGSVVGIVNSRGESSGWGRPISLILEKTSFFWQFALLN